jgi:hypothetical protein
MILAASAPLSLYSTATMFHADEVNAGHAATNVKQRQDAAITNEESRKAAELIQVSGALQSSTSDAESF